MLYKEQTHKYQQIKGCDYFMNQVEQKHTVLIDSYRFQQRSPKAFQIFPLSLILHNVNI